MQLLIVIACAVVLALPRAGVWGGDTAWQEAVGRWMVENRQILTQDIFSWTLYGRDWVNHSWLWDVALYLSHKAFGDAGPIVLLFVVPAAIAGACVYLLLSRRSGATALPLSFAITAFVAATPVWYLRPAMWGLALFSFALVLALRGGRAAWLLPALAALAANVHAGSALAVPAAAILVPWPAGRKAALAAAAAAATLVNPWETGMWRQVVFTALAARSAWAAIPEWQPPSLLSLPGLGAAACAALLLPALRRREPAAWLAAALLAAGLFSQRHLALAFAACAAAVDVRWSLKRGKGIALAGGCLAASAAGFLALVLPLLASGGAPGVPVEQGQVDRVVAVLSAAGAKRPFTPPAVGDYLLGRVPVASDGRGDFYQAHGWWGEIATVATMRVDPGAKLREWGCDAAVVVAGSALDRWLEQAPEWRLALREGAFAVYLPKPTSTKGSD